MTIPCKNCLLIALCKNKYFLDMKNECSLIERYLFKGMIYDLRKDDFNERIDTIHKIMNPKYWKVDYISRKIIGDQEEQPVQEFSYRKRAKRWFPDS